MSRNDFSSASLSSFHSTTSSDDGVESAIETVVVVGCFDNSVNDEAVISEALECARANGGKVLSVFIPSQLWTFFLHNPHTPIQVVFGVHDNASAREVLGEEPALDLESRMSRVSSSADQVFAITSADPSVFLKSFLVEQRTDNVMLLSSEASSQCFLHPASSSIEIAN